MKIIFYILFFYSILFGNEVNINFSHYIDNDGNLSINEILKSDKFREMNKTYLGYVSGNIWSKIELKNSSNINKSFILKNDRHIVFELDAYIFANNELQNSYFMGAARELQNRVIAHRVNLIPINLKSFETKIVFVRINSKAPINIHWEMVNLSDFSQESLKVSTFWGIYGGLVLALMIYNLMIFFALKQIEYFYYVCMSFFLLALQFAASGTFYILDFGLNSKFILYSTWFTPIISTIFLLLFADSFFKMKASMPKFRVILLNLIAILSIFIVIFIFGLFENKFLGLYNYLSIIFLIITIFLFFVALMGVKQKSQGANYYLIGQGALVISLIFSLAMYIGIIELNSTLLLISPLASLVDMIFLSIALGQKIKFLEIERKKSELTLFANARFISIGQAIANITHQWKMPLSRAGSLVMQIDDIVRHEKENLNSLLKPPVDKLQSIIDFMANTTYEITDFYKTEQTKIDFSINKEIKNVLEILSGKINLIFAKVEISEQEEIFIHDYRYALSNTLMIIIDNSLDILKERKVKNPHIKISLLKNDNYIYVIVSDNGGGIEIKPIEAIFEIFISSKNSGLGLALAKNLVENKIGGSLKAKNIRDGAEFTLLLKD